MPEQRQPRRPWFQLITEGVLGQAGPKGAERKGADVYAGQPSPKPGDNRTQDDYAKAERTRNG